MAAKFYTTPLVKVGDSATIFTSNIYLSGATNVGSYGVELEVSGSPSNVSYSYTAANVGGFSASAYSGLSAFSSSVDVGGFFSSAGVLIGSVTVTFATAPLATPRLVLVSANLENLGGDPIAVTLTEVSAGATVEVLAYSWKAHTLLTDVNLSVVGTDHSGITGASGSVSFATVTDTNVTLSATRTTPDEEAGATSAAVNLQDAIAILKMIVGLPVNSSNQALSPYQALAADYDGNGVVQLSDAIAVLKHVVGLTAPDPTWHFVNELDASVPGKASLNPGLPQATATADLSSSSPVHVGLVGYLSGDVDGSYTGATGASDLDIVLPNYFSTLVGAHPELSFAQFGM